jgi:hypothetical protein
MGDDHLARLHLRADYESHRLVHLQVLDALEVMGQGGEPEGGVICFGGSQCSQSPFNMWLGFSASGWTRQLDSTDLLILSSSCNSTQSPSGRLEAMGASWPTGSQWLQKESLADGSGGCPWSPSRLGGVSASASSTNSLLWGQSLRTHRS